MRLVYSVLFVSVTRVEKHTAMVMPAHIPQVFFTTFDYVFIGITTYKMDNHMKNWHFKKSYNSIMQKINIISVEFVNP
jgi:hypothetical protein